MGTFLCEIEKVSEYWRLKVERGKMGDEENIAVIAAAVNASLQSDKGEIQKSLWRRSFHSTPSAWKSTQLTWKATAKKEMMKSRDLTHR